MMAQPNSGAETCKRSLYTPAVLSRLRFILLPPPVPSCPLPSPPSLLRVCVCLSNRQTHTHALTSFLGLSPDLLSPMFLGLSLILFRSLFFPSSRLGSSHFLGPPIVHLFSLPPEL